MSAASPLPKSIPKDAPPSSAAPTARAKPIPAANAGPGTSASPAGTSFRRGGRSFGFDLNGQGDASSDWRARGESLASASGVAASAGTGISVGAGASVGTHARSYASSVANSLPSAAVRETASGAAAAGSPGSFKAPERTVGGFEKREVRSGGQASALSGAKDKDKGKEEKGEVKPAALSHVPCRFFKAGACTAGASCPFSHELGGKKEICQWFLKGECKFGHKCALAHVRPGEPMSMDRKNKKEQQREARERADRDRDPTGRSVSDLGTSPLTSRLSGASPIPTSNISHPVPIKSALGASLQSASAHSPGRFASSPLREPYGPPAAVVAGSPSAGFNNSRVSGAPGFGASPSRPSPLSASFQARGALGTSFKGGSSLVSTHSPLRPPTNSTLFSSSFQHSTAAGEKSSAPMSASYADNTLRKSIWARSETPDEPLSPARRPIPPPNPVEPDVFDEHDDHGEDLLPSSLNELLTPHERARRMSRHDSHDSYVSGSSPNHPSQYLGAERLAQSATAALPAGNFLQALWNQDGKDARVSGPANPSAAGGANGSGPSTTSSTPAVDLNFGPSPSAPQLRSSLLSQQRNPSSSSLAQPIRQSGLEPYLVREHDPSSPSARALQEHAPGQSLPGGLAAALSRMHLQPGLTPRAVTPSGTSTGVGTPGTGAIGTPPSLAGQLPKRDEHEDEGLFHMDG